jgi:hypothetical protein
MASIPARMEVVRRKVTDRKRIVGTGIGGGSDLLPDRELQGKCRIERLGSF